MSSIALLAVLTGVISAPAAVASPRSTDKITVCHRTGNKTIESRFVGHTITVGQQGALEHVTKHGDVVISDAAKVHFTSSKTCLIDAQKKLFTENGTQVQPLPVVEPPPEEDWGDYDPND